MDHDELIVITKDRLAQWEATLADQHGTPIILLGMSHDETECNLLLCVTSDMTKEMIMASLARVIELIASGQSKQI